MPLKDFVALALSAWRWLLDPAWPDAPIPQISAPATGDPGAIKGRKDATEMKKPKKKSTPLTQLVDQALAKHGPGTTDAIARRVGHTARATGKALSKRKQQGKAYFVVKQGEAVWRRGAPRKRAARKR